MYFNLNQKVKTFANAFYYNPFSLSHRAGIYDKTCNPQERNNIN